MFPPLTVWLLAVYCDQHSLLLPLLPHLLHSSKGLEVVPRFYFLFSLLMAVFQPAAIKASSTDLHTLVLLTTTGFLNVEQAF